MESSLRSATIRAANGSPRVSFVPARESHCFAVGDSIREEDRMEMVHAVGPGMSPGEALDYGRLRFPGTIAAILNGKPAAILGCYREGDHGVPWFMGSRVLNDYPVLMTRTARRIALRWKEDFGKLESVVWSESKAVRWLLVLGFHVLPRYKVQCADGSEAYYHPFRM